MSHNNTVSVLQPSTGSPPTPTPQAHHSSQRVSKAILKTAIHKANSAVVLDKANDLTGAIDAYTEAVNLLDRVLSSETREADRQRLQETHNKYMKRIQYLTTLKSDADDLYETFENGGKPVNDPSRAAKSFQSIAPKQQQLHSKGRSDMWVRKMNSSSSLDKRSNRLETETALSKTTTTARSQQQSSTAVTTPTSPSSINSPPVDVPLSPVSSKSTPSRPSSNRKSNDTLAAVDSPPPLEPRSIHRPSPRKSSRTGAAAALQQGPIEPIPSVPPVEQNHHHHHHQPSSQHRRSSMSSLSSMSSSDSDVIRVSSSHQPTMALPSLLHSKKDATSIPTTVTTSETTSSTISSPSSQGEAVLDDSNRRSTGSNRHSNDSSNNDPIPRPGSHPTVSTTPSMVSLMSSQDEPTQQSGTGGFGRLRTSSLPRKLHFTRPVIGSSTRMQRLASNASSLDMNDTSPPLSSSSSISSGVPMRRNATQPSTPVTPIVDPDTVSTRTTSAPAPPQRQSSGLSMRKKYNRLSRTSMDGVVLGGGNSAGRKDKSGPIFSTLFGNSNSPNSNGRSTDEAINYFGKDDVHPTEPVAEGDSTMTPTATQQGGPMNRYLDVHLKLIIALEHSMNYGGYITPKLFIPKNLWHQSYIRISSLDVKVAACESLILDLNRIEKWRNLDDIRGSLRLIESLEEVVDGLQVTLSKKLKQDSIVDMNDDTSSVMEASPSQQQQQQQPTVSTNTTGSSSTTISSNGSINKRAQFMSWGSKLSKSVERMNNFSLSKVEDQHRHYIEVLQKLFIKLHMLEMWFQHYLKKDRQKNPHYDALLTKLGKVCDGINRVVGGFVLRDVAILLGKWLKRGGVWVNE